MKLSNYFGKNLWCTFTENLNKKCQFLIVKVIKSWIARKYTAQQTLAERKKYIMEKAQQTFYSQKDHFPWNTGSEK